MQQNQLKQTNTDLTWKPSKGLQSTSNTTAWHQTKVETRPLYRKSKGEHRWVQSGATRHRWNSNTITKRREKWDRKQNWRQRKAKCRLSKYNRKSRAAFFVNCWFPDPKVVNSEDRSMKNLSPWLLLSYLLIILQVPYRANKAKN